MIFSWKVILGDILFVTFCFLGWSLQPGHDWSLEPLWGCYRLFGKLLIAWADCLSRVWGEGFLTKWNFFVCCLEGTLITLSFTSVQLCVKPKIYCCRKFQYFKWKLKLICIFHLTPNSYSFFSSHLAQRPYFVWFICSSFHVLYTKLGVPQAFHLVGKTYCINSWK